MYNKDLNLDELVEAIQLVYDSTAGPNEIHSQMLKHIPYFVCFVALRPPVNSYGHCGTVSSHNHTFSCAGLNKWLTSNSCTYVRL